MVRGSKGRSEGRYFGLRWALHDSEKKKNIAKFMVYAISVAAKLIYFLRFLPYPQVLIARIENFSLHLNILKYWGV